MHGIPWILTGNTPLTPFHSSLSPLLSFFIPISLHSVHLVQAIGFAFSTTKTLVIPSNKDDAEMREKEREREREGIRVIQGFELVKIRQREKYEFMTEYWYICRRWRDQNYRKISIEIYLRLLYNNIILYMLCIQSELFEISASCIL